MLNKMSLPSVEEYFRRTVCQVCTTQIEDSVRNPHLEDVGHTNQTRGSGFLVDAEYFTSSNYQSEYVVVTNFHVIARAVEIHVRFHSKEDKIPVKVLTANPQFDLAILTFQGEFEKLPTTCQAIPIGKSSDVKANTELYGVGFPLGMPELQIQRGYRTGFHIGEHDVFLQHSVPLNPGNSGGPLCLLTDDPSDPFEVVGISNAIVAGAQAIDFSILVERLMWVAEVWSNTSGSMLIQSPFELGVNLQTSGTTMRKYLLKFSDEDIDRESGVLVTNVKKGTISDGVFHASDVITEVSGLNVDDAGHVVDPTLGRAAPAIPLHIYVSRQPHLEMLEFDIIRQLPEEQITKFGARTYTKTTVEAHLTLPTGFGPKEIYTPFEKLEFEILSGMILVDTTLNAAREFKRALPAAPHVMVVNLLPQGDVMHGPEATIATPGTILTHVNFEPFDSIKTLRKLLRNHWHPDENCLIFTTEKRDILTLPLVDLNETNNVIKEIYGPSSAASCIPLARSTEASDIGGNEFINGDELRTFEEEMYKMLGLNDTSHI